MDNYAQVSRKLTYDDPDHELTLDGISDDPYNVDESYYVTLIMKEWQSCPSDVAKEYFSVTNIKRIQKGIRREIYNRSHGKFRLLEDQNVSDLLSVMRAVYDQYGANLPYKIIRQVKYLNEQTIQYIAPDMMTNLKQHYGYLDDIKNPINPLPQPINVNNAGRLQLASVAQLYGI